MMTYAKLKDDVFPNLAKIPIVPTEVESTEISKFYCIQSSGACS